jgi:Xaa-Pro aminopeptidase
VSVLPVGSRRAAAHLAVGSSQAGGDEPLKAGMICPTSRLLQTGGYGIRIENLILVAAREVEGAEKSLLGFDTLTWAPIDRNLVEVCCSVKPSGDAE